MKEKEYMKLTVCASGDLMLLDHFPETYDFSKIGGVIQENDVKITNLESVVSKWDCFASTYCGGQWINSEPEILKDVEKYGFNFYSCANNHSMDYSYDGLLSTVQELKLRKWLFAGIGKSLDEASAPAYLQLYEKNIVVALISVTSTFIDAARAGNGRNGIPARPGINPLRVQTKFLVSQQHCEQLKKIAEVTCINGERDNARKIGSLPPEEPESINFGGNFFVATDGKEGKNTYCNKQDLNRICHEIENAKLCADYVFICVHSHQIKRMVYFEPDYFLEEFAHTCIDVGASAVIGGGTHQLKPIEIYKNKPIFYSLGNFVFEDKLVKKLPQDFWDKYHYPNDMVMEEAFDLKTKNGTIGLQADKNNFLSVIPLMEFDSGDLINIKLVPIELQFNADKYNKGLPQIAETEDINHIYKQLCKISKAYGTEFHLGDEVIHIRI